LIRASPIVRRAIESSSRAASPRSCCLASLRARSIWPSFLPCSASPSDSSELSDGGATAAIGAVSTSVLRDERCRPIPVRASRAATRPAGPRARRQRSSTATASSSDGVRVSTPSSVYRS